MGFPAWEGATHCTGSASAGAQALMRWIIEEYGDRGAQNWGIYNCRDVRGGETTSLHGEGRAGDTGFPVGDPDGDRLVKRLLKAPGRLGIQAIIYERRIYSRQSPEGRHYDGAAPHYDHVHWELTREAAENLTFATVKRVLSPVRHSAGSRNLRKGMKGADVRWVQRKLSLNPDGVYGDKTAVAVRKFEKAWNAKFPARTDLKADGVVGKRTWRAWGVKPQY